MGSIDKRVFVTYTGKQFNFADIKESDICLEDIAHHLTKICRYGGAMELEEHYSVAQHSIHLCDYALNELDNIDLARYILLHDATEAYMGDVVSGLKKFLPDYKRIEQKLHNIIIGKYGMIVDDYLEKEADRLDKAIPLDECEVFLEEHVQVFRDQLKDHKQLGIYIPFSMRKSEVKEMFLDYCRKFNIKD